MVLLDKKGHFMKNIVDHNAANEAKWSQRSITFDRKWNDIFRYLQWELIRYAGIQAPCNFLDVGCGTGWAVRYASRLLNGNGRFVGIDLSKGMIERAKKQVNHHSNVEFLEGSAEHLPVESGNFDTIICTNSFHHYLLPVEALEEMNRILRPGGRVFILDLTSDDYFSRWIDRRTRANEKEHVKYYSSAEFQRMFTEAGIWPILSRPLKILYPLKVHVGEKPA